MKPTQDLIEEPDGVLLALQLLEKVEGVPAAGDEQAPEHLDQLLDLLNGFVDRCHRLWCGEAQAVAAIREGARAYRHLLQALASSSHRSHPA